MTVAELDLEAVEADAKAKIAELEKAAERLAPEALTDRGVAAELEAVESERRAAELAIEHANAARREIARRDAEAQAQAEAEARAQALERARAIDVERVKAAVAVDAALRKAGFALADLARLARDESAELAQAALPRLTPPSRSVMGGALFAALGEAGVKAGDLFEIERPIPERRRPLAETVRPVDFGGAAKVQEQVLEARAAGEAARAGREVARARMKATGRPAHRLPDREPAYDNARPPSSVWCEYRQAGLSVQEAADRLAHEYQRPLGGAWADPWLTEQVEQGEKQYLESINKETER